MISVVIPTLNAQNGLPLCLSALVPAIIDGLVTEVIIADGGSTDGTHRIVDQSGATLITCPSGRGLQLATGAQVAKGTWMLFLHADTILESRWVDDAKTYIEKIEIGRRKPRAAAFQFALDDDGFAPRILEALVRLRSNLLRTPYGDQGLLISKQMYNEIGGYKPIPLMEDLDIVRRLGRSRISILRSRAITSPQRYQKHGYLLRVLRNQICLAMYTFGVSPNTISNLYDDKSQKP